MAKTNRGTTKNRVHVDITKRDESIFKCLGPGPKTLEQIRDALARRQQQMMTKTPLNHDLKMATLKARVHSLCKAEYIVSKRYRTRAGKAFALYALTSLSVSVLKEIGYPVNMARMAFPHENTVEHEQMVIGVVERYWVEPSIMEKDGRTVKMRIRFQDENSLKSSSNGGKKGWRYPDLLTTLTFSFEDQTSLERHLAVEIDNGTMSCDRVFTKIRGMFDRTNYATLMLCPDITRADRLKHWFSKEIERLSASLKNFEDRAKLADLRTNVAFALHDDFIRSGFRSTDWRMIDGSKATPIPAAFAK